MEEVPPLRVKGEPGGPAGSLEARTAGETDRARWGRSRRWQGQDRRGQGSPSAPPTQPRFLGFVLIKLQGGTTQGEPDLCQSGGTWGLRPLLPGALLTSRGPAPAPRETHSFICSKTIDFGLTVCRELHEAVGTPANQTAEPLPLGTGGKKQPTRDSEH